MPAIVVPKSNLSYGAGYLYRALLGSPLPGTVSTVTQKALSTNVVTLTVDMHNLIVGDSVTVALSPADPVFDGTYTVTAVTTTTISYAKTNTNVTATATAGTVTGPFASAGGVSVGSKFVDSWPTAWVPWGVTREGHETSYAPDVENIPAAEYYSPLKYLTTSVESGMSMEVMEITAKNMSYALGSGGTVTTRGTLGTAVTRVGPPAAGQDVRIMLGWESEQLDERWVGYQSMQTGEIKPARKKGADNAGLELNYMFEQGSTYTDPFNHWFAGATRIGV